MIDPAKKFNVTVVTSEMQKECVLDSTYCMYSVQSDFERLVFQELNTAGITILRKPELIQLSSNGVLT